MEVRRFEALRKVTMRVMQGRVSSPEQNFHSHWKTLPYLIRGAIRSRSRSRSKPDSIPPVLGKKLPLTIMFRNRQLLLRKVAKPVL